MQHAYEYKAFYCIWHDNLNDRCRVLKTYTQLMRMQHSHDVSRNTTILSSRNCVCTLKPSATTRHGLSRTKIVFSDRIVHPRNKDWRRNNGEAHKRHIMMGDQVKTSLLPKTTNETKVQTRQVQYMHLHPSQKLCMCVFAGRQLLWKWL